MGFGARKGESATFVTPCCGSLLHLIQPSGERSHDHCAVRTLRAARLDSDQSFRRKEDRPCIPAVTPKWFVIIALIAFTSLGPALALAQTPVAAPGAAPAGEPAGAEWTTYGGNLYNQRYSSLDQINQGHGQGPQGRLGLPHQYLQQRHLVRILTDRHRRRDVPDRPAEPGLRRRRAQWPGEMEVHPEHRRHRPAALLRPGQPRRRRRRRASSSSDRSTPSSPR